MSDDVSCVINAHREGLILYPSIASVRRAVAYAQNLGLKCSVHLLLDRPDKETKEIAFREMESLGSVHEVDYGDLADARNHAVNQVEGVYTAFIDGDDLWGETWLADSYQFAKSLHSPAILHPEYNIYFGSDQCHVFNHVDMDAQDFQLETLLRMNYWTALSFAESNIYKNHPYQKNAIADGFGYEDWNWNYETIQSGIKHKVVPGTAHFIRKHSKKSSLLSRTNHMRALPRIYNIYRDQKYMDEKKADYSKIVYEEQINQLADPV